MTEEMVQIQNWTPQDREAASQTKQELDRVLDEIQSQEKKLETDFVKLGTMIDEVREKKFWLLWDYKSFNAFLEAIAPKVGKGRSRLYACAGICRELLPYLPPEELSDIGISKASAIASAVKKSGKKPSDELLKAAKNPATTLDQMQGMIADSFGLREDMEYGTWFALSGIFLSDEEREELMRGIRCACKVDPAMNHVIDKWQDASAGERKEVIFRWVREFLGTWEAETEKGAA